MMKTKTKQNIPKGWVSKTVSDLCANLDNKRVPITKSDRVSGNIPYYGATGIVDYVEYYIFDEEILLIGEDGADWSAFANTSFIVSDKSWVNNHAHVLKCKESVLSTYLKEYFNWKNLDYYTTGGTRKKLNKEALMNIPVVLPELKKEQQKIAEVLVAVDEEIEKTKEVIKATEKLKKGLMQQLFTRGIGHTKFKQTELGEIPERWKIIDFKDVVSFKTGKLNSNATVAEGTYPFFTCSQETFKTNTYAFDQEAILLAGNNAAGKYSVKHFKGKFDAYQRTYVITILNDKQLDYVYFKEVLQEKLEELRDRSFGSTTKFLTLKLLESLQMKLPPIAEQKQIAEIMSALDEKIAVNKKLLAKQTELKKGLMQDLLSGIKRVKV